jgi:hypothetical protein
MKRTFISLFLLLFISYLGLFAQNTKITWGETYKNSAGYLREIVKTKDGGFYTFELKGLLNPKIVLQKFDNKLNKVDELEEEHGRKENKAYGEILSFPEKSYILYRNVKVAQNHKLEIYAQELNTKKLALSKEMKLYERETGDEVRANTAYGFGDYASLLSRDSSKLLLSVDIPNKNKRSPNKYGFKVYNEDLIELWNQEYEFPIQDRFFYLQSPKVDNEGNVYCLGRVDTDAFFDKRRGKPTYSYHIYYVSPNEAMPVDIPIKLKDYFISDVKIEVANNGDILCGGFYSKKATVGLDGVFSLTIDGVSKQIKQQSLKEISIQTIAENNSEFAKKRLMKRQAKGKDQEMYNFDLKNLVLKKEGGFLLVGEQYYITTYTVTDQKTHVSRTHYVYHYNDIIVFNVSPQGEIVWTEKIGKRQVTTDDGGFLSSYALMVHENKLHFLFNDNAKNLTYDGKGAPYGMDRRMTAWLTVDEKGKTNREQIFTYKKTKLLCNPKYSVQVSPDEMVVYFQRYRKRRFAKITLD